jgi:TRAP transporter TAXI family solute receptor
MATPRGSESSASIRGGHRTAWLRRAVRWFLLIVVIALVAVWYSSSGSLPREIRIAASSEGGMYYEVARLLKPAIEERTGRTVVLLATRGSVENREKLLSGEADLAILQDGTVDRHRLSVVAPLYREVVHLLVRKGSKINCFDDLAGRNVVLGPAGSGMRESALVLVRHYGLDPASLLDNERYFGELISESSLDAAIVTTGFLNHDLQKVMATRQFDLLSISDAEALSIHYPYLSPQVIPTGVFEGHSPVPEAAVPSVATTALLAAHDTVSAKLVRKTLEALYESGVRQHVPTLIPLNEARQTGLDNLHPMARSYFDPYAGVELVSNLLESMSAVKELLFALGACLYLAWSRRKRAKERQDRATVEIQKERLDTFLEQTIRLEQAQMEASEPEKLREFLDEVTQIKLRAIRELTHEDLRGDRMFSIFLLQCGDLAGKIQAKIGHCEMHLHEEREGTS